jgi:hypothetical protein
MKRKAIIDFLFNTSHLPGSWSWHLQQSGEYGGRADMTDLLSKVIDREKFLLGASDWTKAQDQNAHKIHFFMIWQAIA